MEVFLGQYGYGGKSDSCPPRRSSKSRCLANAHSRLLQYRGNAPVSEKLVMSRITPYNETLNNLAHLEWLKTHLHDPPSYPPSVLADRQAGLGGNGQRDSTTPNPREAIRERMNAAASKVTRSRPPRSRGTPRAKSTTLPLLANAPRGIEKHLDESKPEESRSASPFKGADTRGLSVLSRKGSRQRVTGPGYVPLRTEQFNERMAAQHAKMQRTFGYEPPDEGLALEEGAGRGENHHAHLRRRSIMTRGTRRKFDEAEDAVGKLTRKGNGWVVNWRTRKSAVDQIALAGPAALTHLDEVASRLKDDDWGVRASAADALAAMGKVASSHAGEIVAILGDPNPTVRSACLKALPQFGGDVARLHWEKVVHALENDDSDQVRNTAFEVIREMCMMKPGAEREQREREAKKRAG